MRIFGAFSKRIYFFLVSFRMDLFQSASVSCSGLCIYLRRIVGCGRNSRMVFNYERERETFLYQVISLHSDLGLTFAGTCHCLHKCHILSGRCSGYKIFLLPWSCLKARLFYFLCLPPSLSLLSPLSPH